MLICQRLPPGFRADSEEEEEEEEGEVGYGGGGGGVHIERVQLAK